MYFLILIGVCDEILCEYCNIVVINVVLGKLFNLSLNKMERIIVENIIWYNLCKVWSECWVNNNNNNVILLLLIRIS